MIFFSLATSSDLSDLANGYAKNLFMVHLYNSSLMPASNMQSSYDRKTRFITLLNLKTLDLPLILDLASSYESRHEKPALCICTKQSADQLHGYRKADQRLCNRYIDSTASVYLLNPEIQAPSHLLWLYSPVCVGTGRNPDNRFSQDS